MVSLNYIQNGTAQQASANFNISGTDGSANARNVNSATTYQIGGSSVLSIGSFADENLFLGVGAGANNIPGQGQTTLSPATRRASFNTAGGGNTFSGLAGRNANTAGGQNIFTGYQAGFSNTTGDINTFTRNLCGFWNTTAYNNTYVGARHGAEAATKIPSRFLRRAANRTGYYNTFSGSERRF